MRNRGEGFGAEVKRRILTGTYVLSAGYFDAYYLQAQKARKLISDDFARAFRDVDFVAGPTTPSPAFGIGQKTSDPIEMYLNDIYTIGANLAGLPAMSIPCGFVRNLPVGLAARRAAARRKRACLKVAHHFQRATDWHARVPAELRVSAMQWEIVIGLEIHAQLATHPRSFRARRRRTARRRTAKRASSTWAIPACCRC